MSSETEESQAVVPVAMDVEMANGADGSVAADGLVQVTHAGNVNGGAAEVQAAKAGQESDGKVKAPEYVKEGEKKEARKQMHPRSKIWKHYKGILIDGVLQKGKCNYCNKEIAAHPLNNGTFALRRHFTICKPNPHRNIGDDKRSVLQVNHGDSVHGWKFDPEALRNSFAAMIIEDELPWAFGEKSGFKRFMSVACPCFSVPSSGRVLDGFRTSLTSFMAEALVCTQDWLRHGTPISIAENTEELTKLEQELIAEYKDVKAKATKTSTTAKSTS